MIQIWDVETQTMVEVSLEGHSARISLCRSRRMERLASGSWDITIRIWIWDVQKREMVDAPLEGHGDYVSALAFSLDGNRIRICQILWKGLMGSGACLEAMTRGRPVGPRVQASSPPARENFARFRRNWVSRSPVHLQCPREHCIFQRRTSVYSGFGECTFGCIVL